MIIRVDGKIAKIKDGSSFEFVSENRLFSGSDGYTLSIIFPLVDCPENVEIFGHINRNDVYNEQIEYDCEIVNADFCRSGLVTITEITDNEVKAQFIEGRTVSNDIDFDKIYINELSLGNGSDCDDSTPPKAWSPGFHQYKCVALPWVNNDSGNIQNLAEYHEEEHDAEGTITSKAYFSWHEDCDKRSWQPYLLYITKQICEQIGYTADLSEWEKHEEYKYLLICNVLPQSWDLLDFSMALPHWTVTEYFEKLELFLGGEFIINHRTQSINFDFTKSIIESLAPIKLNKVLAEHSVEVSDGDSCEYQEAKNLVYKDCDHEMWKYYSCDWFIKGYKNIVLTYPTMTNLLSAVKGWSTWDGNSYRGSGFNKILYAEDIDCYFILRAITKTLVQERPVLHNVYSYKMELRPINMLGGRIVDDSEDADEVEIEFVPSCIDYTEDKYGYLLFLSPGATDEGNVTSLNIKTKKDWDEWFAQPYPEQWLESGEKSQKAEYYDCIYVGWWDGSGIDYTTGKLPHPYVENIEVSTDFSHYTHHHFSLRLNTDNRKSSAPKIDPKRKFTFKFLSDTIPNPRAVYYIFGEKYICEKITATFTEKGMSQLLKGTFWQII